MKTLTLKYSVYYVSVDGNLLQAVRWMNHQYVPQVLVLWVVWIRAFFLSGTTWAPVSQNSGSSLMVLASKGMSESLSGPGVAADRSSDTIYASSIHRSYGMTCIAGRRLSSNLYSIFIPYPRSLPLLISCSGFLSCCTSKRWTGCRGPLSWWSAWITFRLRLRRQLYRRSIK